MTNCNRKISQYPTYTGTNPSDLIFPVVDTSIWTNYNFPYDDLIAAIEGSFSGGVITNLFLSGNTTLIGELGNGEYIYVDLLPLLENEKYLTAGTYSDGFIYFSGHGVDFSVDVSSISGNDTELRNDFNFHTGDTNNPHQTSFYNLTETAHTHSIYATENFKTFSVAGQSDVVADTLNDTLTLSAGTNIVITTDPGGDVICISGPEGAGEANTASNLNGGYGLYVQKVGVDLQFKSLLQGSNITLSADTESILISSTASGSGTLNRVTVTASTYYLTNTNDVIFLNATSNNITVYLHPSSGATAKPFYFKRTDSATNSVTLSASTNIDGSATRSILNQYDAYTLTPNDTGSQWFILA